MSADRAPADFGSMLRQARERRGVSLRQIANATKISMAVLEALERNDISKLPGGIFGRAFVRSYANEVGLNPEATIQEFIAQFPHESVTAGHPTSDRIEDNEALESRRRMARTVLWLVAVSIPIAGAVLYFTAPSRRVQQPIDAAVARLNDEHPAPKPTALPPDKPAQSAAPAAAKPSIGPPAPASAAAPAAAVTAAATTGEDKLVVGLSVRRPCFVSASVDGKTAIEQLLQAGEQRTIEVRRELVLTAGDASAISMTVNGAEARPLGKAGEVVTARLTPSNFKEYLRAR